MKGRRRLAADPPTGATAAAPTAYELSGGDRGSEILDHVAALRRYARSLTGSAHDADDLVQECLAKAIDDIKPWTRARNVRAYLFSMLRNLYIDGVRRKRMTTSLDDQPETAAPSASGGQLDRAHLREVAAAIRRLPDEQRQVLLLVAVAGLSYQETANVLEVPIGTVMSRLSRGREALRRLLDGRGVADLRRVK